MSKLKTLLGYLVIIAIIGGVGLLAYFALQNQENTVSFKGENVATITGDVGEEVALPSLTKEGYDFLGWFYDRELTNPCGETIKIQKGSTILYPSWQIKTYTVSIKYINSGGDVTTNKVQYGQKFNLSNDVVPDYGYRIVWVESISGQEVTSDNVTIKENCQFEQIQKPKTYKLKYQYNDTSTGQSISCVKDFLFNERTQLVFLDNEESSLVGHTLTGWFYLAGKNKDEKVYIKNDDYLNESMAKAADAGDNLTIYGEYSLNSYRLIVKTDKDENVTRELLYNANVKDALEAIEKTGVVNKEHYTLVAWRYFDSTDKVDFTNVKMPACDIAVAPIYEKEKFNITFYAVFNSNKVKVKDVAVEYEDGLYLSDVSNLDEEIALAVDDYDNWKGHSKIDEYQLDYYYLQSDVDKHYKTTILDVLDKFANVTVADDIVLVYKKTVFYIEYYAKYDFSKKECSDYITRTRIDTKDNFEILSSQQLQYGEDCVFGGWAFVDDPCKVLDYDSFDDVNIGNDVMVFADIYRIDSTIKWQYSKKVVDGVSVTYVKRYVGSHQSVVIPFQYEGSVYGIGGDGAIMSNATVAAGKRFLIYDTIREISTDAFKGLDVFVRFKDSPNPDTTKTGLTIKEGAFTSEPLAKGSQTMSIRRIKLPARTVKVEEGAFMGAFDLEKIEVSKGCAKYYSEDGILYERIEGSSNVNLIAYPMQKQNTAFVIGANVEKIGKGAFYYNISNSLYSITANYNLEEDAVYSLRAKLEEVTIENENALKSIGEKAFFGNYQMMKIELPSLSNLENIGDGAFSGCFSRTKKREGKNLGRSFVLDLNNLSSIPKEMLATARDLDNFTILNMDNVSYIGDRAFIEVGGYINQNLKADKSNYMITLRGQVNYIGASAFYSSWFDIGFSSTFNLVEVDGEKPKICSSAFGSGGSTNYGKHKIIGVDGLSTLNLENVGLYQRVFSGAIIDVNMKFINCDFNVSENWYMGSTFSGSTVNGNIDIIYTGTNEGTTVEFKNSILSDLNVNGNVTIDCANLNGKLYAKIMEKFSCNTLTIKGVSEVQNGLFGTEKNNYQNSGPKNIVFDNSCKFTQFGAGAFNNCDNLKSIVLHSSITSIDALTFANIERREDGTVLTSALSKLETVVINNSTSVVAVNGDLLINDTSIRFKVPSSIINKYANDTNWKALYDKNLIEAF